MLVHMVSGHSALPRRPLLSMSREQGLKLIGGDTIRAVLEEEGELYQSARNK